MKQKLLFKTAILIAMVALGINSFAQNGNAIAGGKPIDGGGGGVIIGPGEGGGIKNAAPGVTNVIISSITATTATVNFNIVAGSHIATLNIAYGVGAFTSNQPSSSFQPSLTSVASSTMLAGLSPNTTYQLRVEANSTAGNMASLTVNFTTLTTLPLTLTSLTAKAIATGNQINWTSASVINVKNIIIERSGADNTFTPLAPLPANATQYIDTNPLAGDNYYRLTSIDNDGTTNTYEKIALVKGLAQEISFYPNPVTNGVLNVVAGADALKSINIINLKGVKVASAQAINNPKNVVISTNGLAKGVYVLQITGAKTNTIKKIMIN
jgi:hypothetical protein